MATSSHAPSSSASRPRRKAAKAQTRRQTLDALSMLFPSPHVERDVLELVYSECNGDLGVAISQLKAISGIEPPASALLAVGLGAGSAAPVLPAAPPVTSTSSSN